MLFHFFTKSLKSVNEDVVGLVCCVALYALVTSLKAETSAALYEVKILLSLSFIFFKFKTMSISCKAAVFLESKSAYKVTKDFCSASVIIPSFIASFTTLFILSTEAFKSFTLLSKSFICDTILDVALFTESCITVESDIASATKLFTVLPLTVKFVAFIVTLPSAPIANVTLLFTSNTLTPFI